jgi:hypothetical protein|tara:strand:+ start:6 stop:356 length:351 start_codon:yes stop_codon:yes gene_type:complete
MGPTVPANAQIVEVSAAGVTVAVFLAGDFHLQSSRSKTSKVVMSASQLEQNTRPSSARTISSQPHPQHHTVMPASWLAGALERRNSSRSVTFAMVASYRRPAQMMQAMTIKPASTL